jgi:hypothetical protein
MFIEEDKMIIAKIESGNFQLWILFEPISDASK